MTLTRMWINQPSTHNVHHNLHGRNVLMVEGDKGDISVRIYFTEGAVVSMQILPICLSKGWTGQQGK